MAGLCLASNILCFLQARGTVRASFEHAVTSYRGSDASQAAIDKVQRRVRLLPVRGRVGEREGDRERKT